MTSHTQRQLFTVTDYHKMVDAGILTAEDRVELIEGEILKMSPIKSEHASVVDLLAEELISQLVKKAIVRIQNPVHLNDYSEPEPDVVIAKYRKDRYKNAHPRAEGLYLIIEVADSSLDHDRDVKAPLYAKAGVAVYWIINLPDQQVEVFQKPIRGQYTSKSIHFPGETLLIEPFSLVLSIGKLFG